MVCEVRRDDPAWDVKDPRKAWNRETAGVLLTTTSHVGLARSPNGLHFAVEDTPWLRALMEYERFGVEDASIAPIHRRCYATTRPWAPAESSPCWFPRLSSASVRVWRSSARASTSPLPTGT